MSHAINPFKQPDVLGADDDDDDDGADAEALDDLAVGHTSASGPRMWFRKMLPDMRARGLFVLAFLAAVAGSVYWLVYTIETKCELAAPTLRRGLKTGAAGQKR